MNNTDDINKLTILSNLVTLSWWIFSFSNIFMEYFDTLLTKIIFGLILLNLQEKNCSCNAYVHLDDGILLSGIPVSLHHHSESYKPEIYFVF